MDCKLSFVQSNGYVAICLPIFILNENFYLIEKQNKEYFMNFFW